MASELLKAQWLFAESLPRLIDHAVQLGYKVTLGEVYRSNEQAELNAIGFSGRAAVAKLIEKQFPLLAAKIADNRGNGIRNSVHCLRLAVDLQLFDASGKWLTDAYPYTLLADFWESLGPTHRAGIRFGDTPHFSLEFNGAK